MSSSFRFGFFGCLGLFHANRSSGVDSAALRFSALSCPLYASAGYAMLKPFSMCLAMFIGSSKEVSAVFRFLRRRIVFDELLDSNFDPPVVLDVTYSVRRRKVMPVELLFALPSAFGGRINALSAALSGGGCGIACIAV